IRQRRWERLPDGFRTIHKALDSTFVMVSQQDVAISWIGPESSDSCITRELAERNRVGSVITQGPNISAHIICKDIRTLELGKPLAAVHEPSGNRVALVGAHPVRVLLDRWNRTETLRCLKNLRPIDRPFAICPTVIAALDDNIDLFAQVTAHIAAIE